MHDLPIGEFERVALRRFAPIVELAEDRGSVRCLDSKTTAPAQERPDIAIDISHGFVKSQFGSWKNADRHIGVGCAHKPPQAESETLGDEMIVEMRMA